LRQGIGILEVLVLHRILNLQRYCSLGSPDQPQTPKLDSQFSDVYLWPVIQ